MKELATKLDPSELEEMRLHNAPEAMPGLPCPAYGINLRNHTLEMLNECTRKQRVRTMAHIGA